MSVTAGGAGADGGIGTATAQGEKARDRVLDVTGIVVRASPGRSTSASICSWCPRAQTARHRVHRVSDETEG